MELVEGDDLARVLLVEVDGALLGVDLDLCCEAVISATCAFASSLLVIDNHHLRDVAFEKQLTALFACSSRSFGVSPFTTDIIAPLKAG